MLECIRPSPGHAHSGQSKCQGAAHQATLQSLHQLWLQTLQTMRGDSSVPAVTQASCLPCLRVRGDLWPKQQSTADVQQSLQGHWLSSAVTEFMRLACYDAIMTNLDDAMMDNFTSSSS